MLTRLEVDGFKNLLDLRVDLGPFTCIAGSMEQASQMCLMPYNS
jgi:hypothetical protein